MFFYLYKRFIAGIKQKIGKDISLSGSDVERTRYINLLVYFDSNIFGYLYLNINTIVCIQGGRGIDVQHIITSPRKKIDDIRTKATI